MKLELNNVTYEGKVKHSFLGGLYSSKIQESFVFEPGCNVLEGNFYTGGWTISYILAKGKIDYVENIKKKELYEIKRESYYVGNIPKFLKVLSKPIRIKQWIQFYLKKSNIGLSFEWIVDSLELEEVHLERPLLYLADRIWVYSFAMGLAKGKNIFCFPWFSEANLKNKYYRFKLVARVVKELGYIVILPVESIKAFDKENTDFIYWKYDEDKVPHWVRS